MSTIKNHCGENVRLCDWCGDLALPTDIDGWCAAYGPNSGVYDTEDMDVHEMCADCTRAASDELTALKRARGNEAVANIRALYVRECERRGTDPIEFELQCLSVGRQFVPGHSLHALRHVAPERLTDRVQHFRWLIIQLEG